MSLPSTRPASTSSLDTLSEESKIGAQEFTVSLAIPDKQQASTVKSLSVKISQVHKLVCLLEIETVPYKYSS